MGANPTQAQGVALFFLAFGLIAAGLATDLNVLWVLLGVIALMASIQRFVKAKPWEHREE